MRGSTLLASVLLCSATAFGQATVEGALTHALSTTTGTAMGKAMGNVTNQMATRVTGQIGQQTSHAVPKSKILTVKPGAQNAVTQPPSGTTAEPPVGGSLIASIQGAKLQPACDPAAKESPDKPADSVSKPPACPATTDAHPSEITLPAPQ